jgi:hypothetical protein
LIKQKHREKEIEKIVGKKDVQGIHKTDESDIKFNKEPNYYKKKKLGEIQQST